MAETPEIGVVILAGGEATRLPNKLELLTGKVPLLVRVYRNVSPGRSTYISCKGSFSRELDALLDCPMVVDRWTQRGPLAGLLSTMEAMQTPLVFAVAGDAPFIDAAFIDRLAQRYAPGDEAVVPVHARHGRRQLEPLAAIYDRVAFLREGSRALTGGDSSMHKMLSRLRVREISMDAADAKLFTNINTADDFAAAAVAWMI
ncbi:MAG: molybdenum cofactor guanylyltransferase [Candidatus Eremiobacteraeota bacterium]|nr:molybdenum cofactor guanylyltransferase [Candidatus Eremiobacteraeota bacterium]